MEVEQKDNDSNYELWDEFLELWPIERVQEMTLPEYNQAGNKETYSAWIENRLDKFGSIWGGSSFKFGVYNRADSSEKETNSRYGYSGDYAWDMGHGDTLESAFESVKSKIIYVIESVKSGDLKAIDDIKLWPVVKWKIASLYQDRDRPLLPCVFSQENLRASLDEVGTTLSQSALYEKAMQQFDGEGILSFSQELWDKADSRLAELKSTASTSKCKYWMYAPGDNAKKWDEFYSSGIMAIGWDEMGDLTPFEGKKQITDHYREVYKPDGSAKNNVLANYEFRDIISVGDIVIAKRGLTEYLGFGVVTSDYYFDDEREGYKHCRNVDWQTNGVWTESSGDNIVVKALTDITKYPDYVNRLIALLDIEKEQKPAMSSEHKYKPTNKIFYGPPGTGKTYVLQKEYLPKYTQAACEVTDSEWLASKIDGLSWFDVIAATLFDLGGEARVPDIKAHRYFKASDELRGYTNKNLNATVWGQLQTHTVADCETVNYSRRQSPEWFSKGTDSTWSFAGEWDETGAEIRELVSDINNGPGNNTESVVRYEFVTFHQSYSYEEFVEGIRPVMSSEGSGDAELAYSLEAGVFKRLCMRAERDPENRYAIFIDEINRGNISKIFGELITLIEPDKRLGCENQLRVTLPYSKKSFGVPSNLDIYATMNTADKSLAYLDTALRRRFSFEELLPNPSLLSNISAELNGKRIDLAQLLRAINMRLEILLDRDHTIGHSNFMSDEKADLPLIFKDRLLPQLTDFFFEDWEKVRMVLADDQVTDESMQFVVRKKAPNGLFSSSTSDTAEASYELNDEALNNPIAYQKIYQTTQDPIED